jgi:hypothetical protein
MRFAGLFALLALWTAFAAPDENYWMIPVGLAVVIMVADFIFGWSKATKKRKERQQSR